VLYCVFISLFAGIVSTAMMTLTEIPSWKKWGLHGVFEWHENQAIINYVFHLSDNKKIHFREIFFLHFLNGILAGIAFPFIISLLDFSAIVISLPLLGILYGFILWILTLIPIHKPITGFSPWNHPLGHQPALASLGGHIVYGFILGLIILFFR
jgi:ribose/xylose/arabinose/galactoside ABC-type transport system permease subunit